MDGQSYDIGEYIATNKLDTEQLRLAVFKFNTVFEGI